MKFENRKQAGKLLAEQLAHYQHHNGIIMAIPRGGVPVAFEINKMLGWPLELMLTKKLGHPTHKEYAIGAVGFNEMILVPHPEVSEEYIKSETDFIRNKLRNMKQKYMGKREPEAVHGKMALIVDDGIATGNTILAAIAILRKEEASKIIVAVPVAARNAIEKMKPVTDELVVLHQPQEFSGVGRFYYDFNQVTDEEVIQLLNVPY